jgi:ferric-dicitrate binding protein FerR (iron transport regulator)
MNRPLQEYQHYTFEQWLEDDTFRFLMKNHPNQGQLFCQEVIEHYPKQSKTLNEVLFFLEQTTKAYENQDKTKAAIQERLEQTMERQAAIRKRRLVTKKRQQRWALAASIALLVGLGSWWIQATFFSTVTYTTNYAEWKKLELPDGSVVRLNANSSLTTAKNWKAGADRSVQLSGEAFFEVSKQPSTQAKFTVVTSDLNVEVLGTTFNVHARGEDTKVFLEEGKVKLQHGEEETAMTPGEYVVYSKKAKKIVTRYAPEEQEISRPNWKDGTLLFEDESAYIILQKIEELYGVKVNLEDETIYPLTYTVAIPIADIDVVIPILERSMNIEITRSGQTLNLK